MRRSSMLVALLMLLQCMALGQDSGQALLSAARKRALDARGKEGVAREKVYEDCVRLLTLVPERYPKEKIAVARAWLHLGRTYRRLDRPGDAEVAFGNVLRIPEEQRSCCEALHDLASLYRKGKRRGEATKSLQRVVDGFPGQVRLRAMALMRLAGLARDASAHARAETLLRQCLREHGDLWRQSVDALDQLVRLRLGQKDATGARGVLDAHAAALRARFVGTEDEDRLENALMKMVSRGRLAKLEARKEGGGLR